MDRRVKSFCDKLAEEAQRLREEASKAKDPTERDRLFRKAGAADTAARINEWVSSSGLQPPK